jgi:tetratricopeptide (TPR) repeat protein
MGISRARNGFLLALALAGAGWALPAFAEDTTLLKAREGAAAVLRGQYDKAIALYDEALATPDIADFVEASIYSDRGVAKWRLKQVKEAIDDFNKSIQLSPENATVYNNRGNALMDLGHPEEAVKDFDRAIALSPNYGAAYNNRGNARAERGQYSQAFQDFRKAVELMPQSPVPFNGRGKAHAALSRHHAAVRDFTRAIGFDPKYAAAYHNRAVSYLAIGKYKEAADDATQAIALEATDPPSVELLLLRGKAYAGDDKSNQALDDFNKAIELKPDLTKAYLERGKVFTKLRRFDDATADFSHVIETDPKNVKAYALRAQAYLQADSNDDALADVNQALGINPNDALALRVRGDIYQALERPDEAIADYRLALTQDPFQAESRDALVRLDQDVPEDTGQPLAPPVSGWVITEPQPGRYIASNPKYPRLRTEIEMFGSGEPRIVEWKLMREALSGIGLLRYYAGDLGDGESMAAEYVAIINTRSNQVVSIEPYSWGTAAAQWNWQAASVVVTDPDGNANEVMLGKPRPKPSAAPVARNDDSFFDQGPFARSDRAARRASRRGAQPSGGGMFNWLFR